MRIILTLCVVFTILTGSCGVHECDDWWLFHLHYNYDYSTWLSKCQYEHTTEIAHVQTTTPTPSAVVYADCNVRNELPFLDMRLAGYTLGSSETPFSDTGLAEGWYSIPGYTLSTNKSGGCGVAVNWYMKETQLPGLFEEINATVCINDGSECFGGSAKMVQIKQCKPMDFLFRLPSTNTGNEGYCLDRFALSSDSMPNVDYITPTIAVEIVKDPEIPNKRQLEYFCRFTTKPNDRVYLYTVTWSKVDIRGRFQTVHSASVIAKNDTTLQDMTKLTEGHLINKGITKLGYSIVCSVMAQVSETGQYSNPIISEVKFCGIKVVSDNLMIVRDAKEAVISLTLTVPFYCPSETCFLDVVLFIPSKQESCEIPRLVSQRGNHWPCGARFAMDDVNKVKNISVANKLGEHGLGQKFDVMLRTQLMKTHDMFSYYLLEPVQIYTYVSNSKLSGKRCYSHSDPHTKSFDQSNTFESIGAGVFVLYRNTKFNTEIQTLQAPCPNYSPERDYPYCNKAVAIRAGRDVYVIDLANYFTGFVLCDDGVLANKVRRSSSKEFRIFLPTGAEVQIVNTWYTLLEIDIYPGLYDFENTEGLCGQFDGNGQNDNIKVGCSNNRDTCWKITDSNSLFDMQYRTALTPWKEELMMCNCQCDPADCSFQNDIVCSHELKSSCIVESYKEVFNGLCLKDIRKRDIHRRHEVKPAFALDHNTVTASVGKFIQDRQRRSATDIDQETARTLCISEMNSTLVQKCSAIPGLDIESYYDNCASDVRASNSSEWTQVHIEGIRHACIQYLEFHKPIPPDVLVNIMVINDNETSFNEVRSTTAHPLINAGDINMLLGEIRDISCMNDCTGHGECIHGICICDAGFISDDCSINVNAAPDIIGIPDEGICDLSERPCKQTALLGRNFADVEALTCKLVPFKIFAKGKVQNELAITVEAKLDTFIQVICPLPTGTRRRRSADDMEINIWATGYTVAVSNNGHSFSVADSIVIFDSTCMDCRKTNGQIMCTKKNGYCVYDGMCFMKTDTLGCYSCQGDSTESLHWIPGPDCKIQTEPSETHVSLIIGLCVGLGAALVTVATVVLLVKFVCKKKDEMRLVPAVLGPAKPVFHSEVIDVFQFQAIADSKSSEQAWIEKVEMPSVSKLETREHVFPAAATPCFIRGQTLDQIMLYDEAI